MSNMLDGLTAIAKEKGIEIQGTIGITHDTTWENAPDWAKWKAQSADGTWTWFSTKPEPYNFGLYVIGTFLPSGKGKYEDITSTNGSHYLTRPNPNWKQTITKRPPTKEVK